MFARGTNIAGYTLVRRLGAGGMGEIWEAVRRDGDFELRAALKVANPEVLAMPEGRALFSREASISASLRHPNIASLLSADLDKGLIFYELVDGADLRQLLSEGSGHRLPMPVIVSLLYQICRGLSHAHRREVAGKLSPVIHRDMSPGNVVIDYDGNLKIVDFGIAKAIAGGERSESIKGKISYMAPEQATAGDVDSRTDQYAVGVMAYEAIAGVRPNDGTHEGETLHNILQGNHRPLQEVAPQVPAGLATLVERMLAVKPAERFPSMDAVIDALEPFQPKFVIHREIAALVHKARPRQTIVFRGGQFDSIPAAAARNLNAAPEAAMQAAPAPQAPTASPFASTVMATDKPVAAEPRPRLDTPPAADDQPVVAQPPKAAPARKSTPPRATLLASTGAIFAAGLVVIILWAMRDKQPAANAELTSKTSAAAPMVPSPPAAAEPAVDDNPAPSTPAPTPTPEPAAELPTGVDPQPTAPAEAAPAPSVTQAPVPAAPAPAKAPKPPTNSDGDEPSSSAGKGHLQVGVFPPTNVWIDGKKRGRSPLSVELRAGKHMVGAGEREPVIRQQVTIHENQTEKILLELGNQPTAVPDNQTP